MSFDIIVYFSPHKSNKRCPHWDVPMDKINYATKIHHDLFTIGPLGKLAYRHNSTQRISTTTTIIDSSWVQTAKNIVKECKSKSKAKNILCVSCISVDFLYTTLFTPISRKKFIDSIVAVLEEYAFDGIHFDWDVLQFHENNTAMKQQTSTTPTTTSTFLVNIVDFLECLKKTCTPKDFSVSMLFGAFIPTVHSKEISTIVSILDQCHVVGHDFATPSSSYLLYHNNIYNTLNGAQSCDSNVKSILLFNPKSTVLCCPLYGYGWFSFYAPIGSIGSDFHGLPIKTEYDEGLMPYYLLPMKDSTEEYDSKAGAAYCRTNTTFVSYESTESLCNKINYIQNNNLQGISFIGGNWDSDVKDRSLIAFAYNFTNNNVRPNETALTNKINSNNESAPSTIPSTPIMNAKSTHRIHTPTVGDFSSYPSTFEHTFEPPLSTKVLPTVPTQQKQDVVKPYTLQWNVQFHEKKISQWQGNEPGASYDFRIENKSFHTLLNIGVKYIFSAPTKVSEWNASLSKKTKGNSVQYYFSFPESLQLNSQDQWNFGFVLRPDVPFRIDIVSVESVSNVHV